MTNARMGTGQRVVLAGAIAALFFVALGLGWTSGYALNNPTDERHQPYRYATDKPLEIDSATARRPDAQAFEYRSPCDNPKGQTESDLCAQWKAANAAEDSAFWAKWGFWIGLVGSALLLWQISLTREAVEDTSEATKSMKRQNEIAELDQRAWVCLSAEPKLVQRFGVDGLYVRVDFGAENVGRSAATHFELAHAVLFQGQAESGFELDARVREQIHEWQGEYTAGPMSNLVPNDVQVGGIWDDFDAEAVKWWDMGIGSKTAHAILLAAVMYRTISAPHLVQLSWRSWYLLTTTDEGHLLSYIPFPDKELGPDRLRTETCLGSMAHEEYEAEYEPRRKRAEKIRTVIIPPKGG